MTDERTASTITLNISDPKTWLLIGALVGIPTAANKLSLSTVENEQVRVSQTAEKAVVKQESIDDKLGEIKSALGVMGYRLEQAEKRMTELQEVVETKTKGPR